MRYGTSNHGWGLATRPRNRQNSAAASRRKGRSRRTDFETLLAGSQQKDHVRVSIEREISREGVREREGEEGEDGEAQGDFDDGR